MSRSYKNRHLHDKGGYISWISYRSNKLDRTIANRTLRHRNNQMIREFDLDKLEEVPEKLLREVSDVYNFNSDGLKIYTSYTTSKWAGKVCRITKEDIRGYNKK